MIAIKTVLTRDRRLVAFDRQRIVGSLLEAMSDAGQGDPSLADELSEAVVHFLARSHGSIEIRVEHIHDMVDKVLSEMGHWEVARSYIRLRDKRARARERIRVRSDEDRDTGFLPGFEGLAAPRVPWVEGRAGVAPRRWDRTRIEQALVEEGDLDGDLAAEIAVAVERRVLRSGLENISTALIRELVDNELFERGHTQTLRRQASLALPKYDLQKVLYTGGVPEQGWIAGDPVDISRRLGDLILSQYALEEVYGRRVREAHREGFIHVHELERPLQYLRARVEVEELVREGRRQRTHEEFFRALFGQVRRIIPTVSEEIELCDLALALHHERLRCYQASRDPKSAASDPIVCGQALLNALAEFRLNRDGVLPRLIVGIPFFPKLVQSDEGLFGGSVLREDTALFLVEALRSALATRDGVEIFEACQVRLLLSEATFTVSRYTRALQDVLAELLPQVPVQFEFVDAMAASDVDVDADGGGAAERGGSGGSRVAGKVTLNLPAIVTQAMSTDGDVAASMRQWGEIVEEAFLQRGRFLKRLSIHPRGALASVSGTTSSHGLQQNSGANGTLGEENDHYVIGVLGLEEAVVAVSGESLASANLLAPAALTDLNEGVQQGGRLLELLHREIVLPLRETITHVQLEESPNGGALRRWSSPLLDSEADTDSDPTAVDAQRPEREASSRVVQLQGAERLSPPSSLMQPSLVRPPSCGVRVPSSAPIDPLQGYLTAQLFRSAIRLLPQLDDLADIRAEGSEVFFAFLAEVARCSPRHVWTPRRATGDSAVAGGELLRERDGAGEVPLRDEGSI